MYLVTLVVGVLLLSKANALKCFECVPGTSETCIDTAKECPSPNNLCAAMRLVTYAGASKDKEIKAKMCALRGDCIRGSVNFGSDKTVIVSECCSSELCNIQHASEPNFVPNGKKCFSCEGNQCMKTLNCDGDQDYCIKSTINVGGEVQTLKGCASKIMCSENPSVLFQNYIGLGSSCCQGDYCNSASSASAGLLLLPTSLLFLVLFT
ncbi:urokinase plasminogen activator surface receptor-like isoform X2 [Cyprinodon tularosa]|uniref:urokinase plasminogen activator surface receptor-like isoform X2 n=1 Tax=Cyprinodon tularosa TaxID=77115 RepID=UPI0018E1FF8D|nr:urokinase plasminogen activator surface receptor-like isoform X2 [Cyprinodon tularosa]